MAKKSKKKQTIIGGHHRVRALMGLKNQKNGQPKGFEIGKHVFLVDFDDLKIIDGVYMGLQKNGPQTVFGTQFSHYVIVVREEFENTIELKNIFFNSHASLDMNPKATLKNYHDYLARGVERVRNEFLIFDDKNKAFQVLRNLAVPAKINDLKMKADEYMQSYMDCVSEIEEIQKRYE